MKKGPLLFVLIVFFVILSYIPAISRDINITADKMEVLEDEGLIIFTGKVFAEERDLKLWADKLYVYYTKSEKGRELQRGVAIGKVRIEKGKWKASAGKATYFKPEEKLILEDQPKVWYENHLVEGDIVIVYFNEDRSEVLSRGGRVRAVIRR
ncbi:MAG: LptA/OstA family protein [Thermodesulfobacteriaceae bacterium]|jgi:lipopolysaccharide export system protein LptA